MEAAGCRSDTEHSSPRANPHNSRIRGMAARFINQASPFPGVGVGRGCGECDTKSAYIIVVIRGKSKRGSAFCEKIACRKSTVDGMGKKDEKKTPEGVFLRGKEWKRSRGDQSQLFLAGEPF